MSQPPITELLQELREGKGRSAERLAEAVHERLQKIARAELSRRSGGRAAALTIEPGMLADDALMAMLEGSSNFENRRHFFAYATRIMVRAVIDHHRRRSAQRRGGDLVRVTLSGIEESNAGPSVDVEDLPPVLEELHKLDPRKAEIVQLRVFWGMTVPEVAEVLAISTSTVDREWSFARSWLENRLEPPAN